MAMDKSFIQLILGLGNLQLSRKQQKLEEDKFGQAKTQFQEFVRQFEVQHGDQDFSKALMDMANAAPAVRTAIAKMGERFGPERAAILQAFVTGQPIAPNVQQAQSSQQGYANLTPEERARLDRETAFQQMSGAGTGAVATSQLRSNLATGTPPPAPVQTALEAPTPSPWQQMVQNYAGQVSAGYTPQQFDVQQYGAKSSTDVARERIMADLQIAGIRGAGQGGLTANNAGDIRIAMGNILNAMKDPKASADDNLARMQLYNELAEMVGSPMRFPIGPNAQPNRIGDPNSILQMYMRRMGAAGAPGIATPQYTGPQPHQR